jgi:hypothetical protein
MADATGNNDDETPGDSTADVIGRAVIRVFIGALAVASLFFAWQLDVPKTLPSVALGQEFVYRAQIFLLAFYAGLLVVTPLFQGIWRGRLPTEISARGAKYDPEEVAASLKSTQERIDKLDKTLGTDVGALISTKAELQKLSDEVAKLKGDAGLPDGDD